jgi:tetratricopeptide (TPR) repeat protein
MSKYVGQDAMLRRTTIGVVIGVVIGLTAGAVFAQTAIIRGIVRDAAGQPLDEVTITAESSNWRRSEGNETDAAGRFSFIGLQPGQWLFLVQKRGFETTQAVANVGRTGDSGTIEFVMEHDPLHPPPPATGVLAGISADDIQDDLDAAHALFDEGNFDAAIAAYRVVLANVPQLTSLHLQIGHAFREKEDYDSALNAYWAVPIESSAGPEAESAIRDLAGPGSRR